MKVVFATHEGVPLYGGGPNVKIHALRDQLQKQGVAVELFDLWKAREQLANCDMVHLFGGNFAVYNLARNLHYQGIRFVVNPIFYSRRPPFILRQVNRLDHLTRKTLPGLWWEWGFTRDICEWAELVLPNTNAEGNLLRQGFSIPAEKIHMIPNGVSLHFRDASPGLFVAQYGVSDFILHVGHIGPARKNMRNLLDALSGIQHPVVLIERVLQAEETNDVLKQIKDLPHVQLIAGLPNRSPLLASAYAASDVFVLPSQFETPGRAALEAALAGSKIVITPHGGTREYFGSNAEYVSPNSVKDIRRGIKAALQAPKSTVLRDIITRDYCWEKIAASTILAYRQVLDK